MTRFFISFTLVLALGPCWLLSAAVAQTPLVIKKLAEKKVTELPPGKLYWQIERFTTYRQAQTAACTWSLVAESAGKFWLFTLGSAGGSSVGGTKVAEAGPIPGSLRRNIFSGSLRLAVSRAARLQCILIPARRPSSC